MDLVVVSALIASPRFPRPRGDGPPAEQHPRWTGAVSPPTRGWTVLHVAVLAPVAGFPAHAGMDPPAASAAPTSRRFPRPRGDGPTSQDIDYVIDGVSPPTRGWTSPSRFRYRSGAGFPAHAGMDPTSRRPLWLLHRFPRPRGDGPTEAKAAFVEHWVSPPTRGWTVRRVLDRSVRAGFPAHAGMDPPAPSAPPSVAWFPRPRGDGPPLIRRGQPVGWVSPPTRGWTPGIQHEPAAERGFPAHAGMDPPFFAHPMDAGRFPRPRGDGPFSCCLHPAGLGVSPPTRGWTPCNGFCTRCGGGFPAHAGMDLHYGK